MQSSPSPHQRLIPFLPFQIQTSLTHQKPPPTLNLTHRRQRQYRRSSTSPSARMHQRLTITKVPRRNHDEEGMAMMVTTQRVGIPGVVVVQGVSCASEVLLFIYSISSACLCVGLWAVSKELVIKGSRRVNDNLCCLSIFFRYDILYFDICFPLANV